MKFKQKGLIVTIFLFLFVSIAYGDVQFSVFEKESFNGHSYLPLREFFERMGYKVQWQHKSRMVEVTKNKRLLYFKPNESYLLLDGRLFNGHTETIIKDDKMYLSIEMVNALFVDIKKSSNDSIYVLDRLVEHKDALPKVTSQVEYDKLLSFYPQPVDFTCIDTVAENQNFNSSKVKDISIDHSKTNNQIKGVDEADFVKTDGRYIYTIKDHNVDIIKADSTSLEVVSTVVLNTFYPTQLFVTDDKLIVMGSQIVKKAPIVELEKKVSIDPATMYYSTEVRIFDIRELQASEPKHLKTYTLPGNLLSARCVNDAIYLVSKNYHYNVIDFPIQYFPGNVTSKLFYTAGIDLNQLTQNGLDVQCYLGSVKQIYADCDSLYLTADQNSAFWWRDVLPSTNIFKFDFEHGKIIYRCQGAVDGYVLNQFSMDEYEGNLRIATTSRMFEGKRQQTANHLYFLDENLKVIGSVENLAKGERIYSTRMMGKKIFIVTYREIDPFYVIDGSDPRSPKLMGYLKIAGYSNYMHPYDEHTIIGIGMNTVQKAGNVINDGVKISVFDISDIRNPIEKDKAIIGNSSAYSEVSYDHKAFLLNREKNIIALPISIKTSNGYSQNAYVFNFNANGMLNFKGHISHLDYLDQKKSKDYDTDITRVFYIENALYTLSQTILAVNDIDNLKKLSHLKR